MNNHIIYQNLEDKYVESAFECWIQTLLQKGTLINTLGINPKVFSQNTPNVFKDNPESYKTTIVAVDTTKHNFVCGIFLGLDFLQFIQVLKQPSQMEEINLKKQWGLKVMDPLIRRNIMPGEILVGNGHGVRAEYENQKISQNLFNIFKQNARDLGFSFTVGVAYNPISAHNAMKLGCFVINRTYSYELEGISEDIRKKIENRSETLLLFQLDQNIPKEKIPLAFPTPSL